MPRDRTPTARRPHVSPGALRATLVRVVGAALACALALLAVIDPMLGLAVATTILAAIGFTRSPTFGVCAFAFVTYFELVTQYTGNTALSPIKVTGGALIVLALLELVTRARQGSTEHPRPAWWSHPVIVAAMASFVALGMVSASWAVNTAQVRTLSERLVTEVLIFLAIGVFLVYRRQFRALALTVLGAGVLSTLLGVALGAQSFGRSLGTFTDPNEYAAAMVASIGLGLGAVGAVRSTLLRAACLAGVAVCGWGLLASQSRGGLVALLAVAVTIVVSARGRERVRMLAVSLVLMSSLVAVLLVTPSGEGALARITDGDSSGRADLWRIARAQFADEPLHGVGLGNFPAVASRYVDRQIEHTELVNTTIPRTTHNSYLEIAAELGVLGLLAFTVFAGGALLLAWRALRWARRLEDPAVVHLGRGLFAATLGQFAACIFLSGHYGELLWALLAACVAYHAMVVREARLVASLDGGVVQLAPALADDLMLEGMPAHPALEPLRLSS